MASRVPVVTSTSTSTGSVAGKVTYDPISAPTGSGYGESGSASYDAYMQYAQAVAAQWSAELGITKTVSDVLAAGGSWAYDPSVDAAAYKNMTDAVAHPDHGTYTGAGTTSGTTSTGSTGSTTAPGGDLMSSLTGDQRNAYTALTSLFEQYGLASLAGTILKYVQQGFDQETTGLLLQKTPEYQTRFAGNALRVKAGLAPLGPAEYLATERSYKSAAAAYGLPTGFYDEPSDFADLIGKDISPQEFSTRASYAFKYVQSGNADARTALQQFYGVDDSHLVAYFLDPQKGQAILDRQAQAVDIGAAAFRQGVGVNRGVAENYADLGVSREQAMQGFGQVSEALDEGQLNIASRFGSDLSTSDVSDDLVAGLASARRKRALLNQSETALFSGNTGANSGSFATDNLGSY